MPKLEAFSGVSQGWINQVTAVASAAVKDGIEEGARFMREAILDSPTTHPWHARKNAANGFPTGARIGNRVMSEDLGEIDPNSGNMLNSVSTHGPFRSGGQGQIAGAFGWIDAQESGKDYYFILQDTGGYEVGAAMGMGLLNGKASGAGGVLRDYGAKVAAEQKVVRSLLSAGFKTGGTF